MLTLLCFLALQDPPASARSDSADRPTGLVVNAPGAFQGYTLFAPLRSKTTYLVDMQGEVVHTWVNPEPPLGVYLQPDGSLLRCARIEDNPTFHGGGLGGRIQELAPDGTLTWEFVLSNEKNTLHHDIEPLPNGNILALAWEAIPKAEAVALGRDPAQTGETFWPCWILEIRPTRPSGGTIVWEWHARDHLVQDFDRTKANFGDVTARPERIDVNADHRGTPPLSAAQREEEEKRAAEMQALGYAGGDEEEEEESGAPAASAAPPGGPGGPPGDWLHLNSIDWHPEHDLILLSSPELNEVWIIDHSTTTAEARGSSGGRWKKGGDLLYRWGNPRMYGAGTAADQQLFYQHQPEWVPSGLPGAGRVTIFNNGRRRPGTEYSSIDELVLPFDPKLGFTREPGKPFGPAKPAWSYSDGANFFSFFISGCQRLPNGNTFICSGKQGRLFEVTPQGEIVWEYWNPYGGDLAMSMGRAAGGPPPPPPGEAPAGAPPGGPGGGGPVEPTSCFRATRLAPDHPGLAKLLGR